VFDEMIISRNVLFEAKDAKALNTILRNMQIESKAKIRNREVPK